MRQGSTLSEPTADDRVSTATAPGAVELKALDNEAVLAACDGVWLAIGLVDDLDRRTAAQRHQANRLKSEG